MTLTKLLISRLWPWMRTNLSKVRTGPGGEVITETIDDMRDQLVLMDRKLLEIRAELRVPGAGGGPEIPPPREGIQPRATEREVDDAGRRQRIPSFDER